MSFPDDTGPRNDLQTIRSLIPYLWPIGEMGLRVRVILAIILMITAKGINVVVPVFFKHAVDALSVGTSAVLAVPVGLLVAYGMTRVLAHAFGELRDAVFAKVAQRAIRLAGLRTFRHLHRLSMQFHLDRQTGGISRAVERGTKGIEFLLTFMLFNILPTLIEILLVCGILWTLYNVWFALVTLGTITGYIVWTLSITEWRIKFRRRMNETDSEANTKAIDSLLNFETVKYFGNEEHEARRFDGALQAYEKAAIDSKTSLSLLNIGQGAIISIGLTVVMIMAGQGVAAGTMTIGDFVLVNAYLIQLYMPLNFLGFVYREIKRSLIDMETMFGLLGKTPGIQDSDHATNLSVSGGNIEFRNVSFRYDPRRPVINDISFKVPAGKTVAIVGPSGSGKSTISRILFRFYDVDEGDVLIDGQDVRTVTQDSLRAAIGIVPQDTVLFNDTVYYNIAYGNPGATPAEVEDAARHAAIHDFVMNQPDGYQTKVGERGLKLSGGEKQRVAIARTILKQPKIMLFDEATSALDTHTEKEIQESLRKVSEGRTTLMIAHRLSTVVDADEIIVLDAGKISERGSHTDLLIQDGPYAKMWARQQEAQEALEVLEEAGIMDGETEAAE
ncbi:MAG: ABC transporter ATP-binding protein/permease [Rhodospirillaceae bacterium]|jgi:ATP-binding cassette, subfamily B, heavy metal transporter|nr:ABC transporter ATP-binding protein/permease [Rhodospirillales bacterium]MBT3907926.1 ABC transporter ATP-binding protein/permease [Rhodospirillaceae bacterium]MBT5035259.1 ABC transporter ATP-binding protein/permease [Rhodospirillaceae bacterium]MBT6218225.1 ABC transporter ATP-binding protein/permease [Rhodospirillaceae bacterium]MBT6364422.1 ABC transporter ATP-binding protein/permease [Rhodospirillaceae bacterium]